MCACLMWIRGPDFDVDAFLENSVWRDVAWCFRAGEQSLRPHETSRRDSGLRIKICADADVPIRDQITACRDFMSQYRDEFQRLKGIPEAKQKFFSLAYYLPLGEVMAIGPRFPKSFLSDLVDAGMEFDFNVFLCTPS